MASGGDNGGGGAPYHNDVALLQSARSWRWQRRAGVRGRDPIGAATNSAGTPQCGPEDLADATPASTQQANTEDDIAVLSLRCVPDAPSKRRRLRGKQASEDYPAPRAAYVCELSDQPGSCTDGLREAGDENATQDTWRTRWRQRCDARKYAVRLGVCGEILSMLPINDLVEPRLAELRAQLARSCEASLDSGRVRKFVASLTNAELQAYYGRCIDIAKASEQPPAMIERLQEMAGGGAGEDSAPGTRVEDVVRPDRVSSVLLTFNGPWGELQPEMVVELRQSDRRLLDMQRLRADRGVQELWADAVSFARAAAGTLQMAAWSLSLEVSSGERSASAEPPSRGDRLHLHMFCAFSFKGPKKQQWPVFRTSQPHLSRPSLVGGRSRGRYAQSRQGQGHYYCLAPKTSQVLSASSDQPKFLSGVRTNWILALYSEGKMCADSAISEIVRCRRDVARSVAAVRAAENAAEESTLAALVRSAQLAEQHQRRPRIYIPAVEVDFLGQFDAFMGRRRFLILTGPSGFGKTDYVRNLASDPAVRARIRATAVQPAGACERPAAFPAHGGGVELLEVSAGGATNVLPDIRELSPLRHGWLLVDELSPSMVAAHRRLFQGKVGWTNLSASATNMYAHKVCAWGIRMVGTANDWRELSAALSLEDRAWLAENSIVVDVVRPLWQQVDDEPEPTSPP